MPEVQDPENLVDNTSPRCQRRCFVTALREPETSRGCALYRQLPDLDGLEMSEEHWNTSDLVDKMESMLPSPSTLVGRAANRDAEVVVLCSLPTSTSVAASGAWV